MLHIKSVERIGSEWMLAKCYESDPNRLSCFLFIAINTFSRSADHGRIEPRDAVSLLALSSRHCFLPTFHFHKTQQKKPKTIQFNYFVAHIFYCCFQF